MFGIIDVTCNLKSASIFSLFLNLFFVAAYSEKVHCSKSSKSLTEPQISTVEPMGSTEPSLGNPDLDDHIPCSPKIRRKLTIFNRIIHLRPMFGFL